MPPGCLDDEHPCLVVNQRPYGDALVVAWHCAFAGHGGGLVEMVVDGQHV